jgi:hypothetical protein
MNVVLCDSDISEVNMYVPAFSHFNPNIQAYKNSFDTYYEMVRPLNMLVGYLPNKYVSLDYIPQIIGKNGYYMKKITEESNVEFIWFHGANSKYALESTPNTGCFEIHAYTQDAIEQANALLFNRFRTFNRGYRPL